MADFIKNARQSLDTTQEKCLEFLKNNLSKENFHTIRELNYANGRIPDYTDDLSTSFYMLKYGKFYMYEYSMMYELALHNLARFGKSEIEIYRNPYAVSFGCGSGIDALSLGYAYHKYKNRKDIDPYETISKCYYRGIDKCEWPALSKPLLNDLDFNVASYEKMDIADVSQTYLRYANILFFPKVMSEVVDENGNSEVMDRLCRRFDNARFEKNVITLCVSFRGNRDGAENKQIQRLVNCFKRKGYWQMKTDIPAGWIGAGLFEKHDDDTFIASERHRNASISDTPEFNVNKDVWDYMEGNGEIRKNCPNFNFPVQESSSCGESCNRNCMYFNSCGFRPIPRIRLHSTDRTCFRVVVLMKKFSVVPIPVVTAVGGVPIANPGTAPMADLSLLQAVRR